MRKSSNLRRSIASADSDGQSNENSPTTATLKSRRVSFANKKHIKEFCDSVEQGTLWVNTYEESESSQLKNSHNSNTDEQTFDGNQPSEPISHQSQNFLQSNSNFRDYDFSQQESKRRSVAESVFNIDAELQRVESAARKNGEIGRHSVYSPEILLDTGKSTNSHNITNYDDTAMDIIPDEMNETAPVASILQSVPNNATMLISSKEPNISPQKLTIFHDRSMDFTEMVPNVPSFEKQRNIFHEKGNTEKTRIFHDNQMDFTEVVHNIPSFEKHRNMIYEKESTEKTTYFHDKQMDFTEVIHNVSRFEKQRDMICEKENIEKTTIFHDKQMDFTEVVPNVPSFGKQRNMFHEKGDTEKTTIFHDKPMDFTEVVHNIPSFEKQRNMVYDKEHSEKTRIFDDKGMDFTEVIHNVPTFEKQRNTNYENRNTEKTTIFHNQSVDLTEVVQNVLRPGKHVNISQLRSFSNRDDVETRDAREMKENIPNMADLAGTRSKSRFEKSAYETSNNHDTEKFTNVPVFHDDSMEMTTPQGNLLREIRNRNASCSKSPTPEKRLYEYLETNSNLQLSYPRSKENFITNSPIEINHEQVNPPRALEPSQKTTVFSDDSMELTVAVQFPLQVVTKNHENNEKDGTRRFSGLVDFQEKENIVHDDLMEIPRTGLTSSQLKTAFFDKENCPVDKQLKTAFLDKENCPVDRQLKTAFLDKENCPVDKENYFPSKPEMCAQDKKIKKPRISLLKFGSLADYEKKQTGSSQSREKHCSNDLTDVSGIVPFVLESRKETWNGGCCSENSEKSVGTMFRNEEMEFTQPVSTFFHKAHSGVERIGREEIEEERVKDLEDFSTDHRAPLSNKDSTENNVFQNISEPNIEQSALEMQTRLLGNAPEINPESSILKNDDMEVTEFEDLSKIDCSVFHKSLESPVLGACSIAVSQLEDASAIGENIRKSRVKSIEETGFVATTDYENSRRESCELVEKSHLDDSNVKDISGVSPFYLEDENENSEEQLLIEGLHSSRKTSLISTGNTSLERDNFSLPAAELSDESRTENQQLHEDIELHSPDETCNVSISMDNDDRNDRNLMVGIIDKNRSRGQLMVQDIDGSYLALDNSIPDELLPNEVSNHQANRSESMKVDNQEELLMEREPVEPDSFSVLRRTIENLSKRSDTIWSIKRMDEKVVAFNFLSKSIVLVVHLQEMSDPEVTGTIKHIDVLSQLVEGKTDPGLQLTHGLVMKKLDAAFLSQFFQTHDKIPELLEYVSREVKMGMDFLFLLENLRNHNVMEFDKNRITFLARTRNIMAGIIVNVTIEMKPFEQINYKDVAVTCLLGSAKIKKSEIQQLVTNIKRDHRFLQLYITDVKDYLDLSAETSTRSATV